MIAVPLLSFVDPAPADRALRWITVPLIPCEFYVARMGRRKLRK